MTTISAATSGTFLIGGDLAVNRLGFGAMRITGDGIWGEPTDRPGALALLRRLNDLGVNLIDTADSYGPHTSEQLIREALHPYGDTVVATKGGLLRPGPGEWRVLCRPDYLRQSCEMSLRRLGVDAIDLYQLHRIDEHEDRDAQFAELAELQREGKIRHLGLSEVTVEQIEAAQQHFTVATVQNLYNVGNRQSEQALGFCEQHGIGFMPWFPLAAGELTQPGGAVSVVAEQLDATPSQVALAWLLQRSSVMLPIPGTSSIAHLEQNVAASALTLSSDQIELLDGAA